MSEDEALKMTSIRVENMKKNQNVFKSKEKKDIVHTLPPQKRCVLFLVVYATRTHERGVRARITRALFIFFTKITP